MADKRPEKGDKVVMRSLGGGKLKAEVVMSSDREVWLHFDNMMLHHPGVPYRILYWKAFDSAVIR